jgi:hypothetical protein
VRLGPGSFLGHSACLVRLQAEKSSSGKKNPSSLKRKVSSRVIMEYIAARRGSFSPEGSWLLKSEPQF